MLSHQILQNFETAQTYEFTGFHNLLLLSCGLSLWLIGMFILTYSYLKKCEKYEKEDSKKQDIE